MNLDEARKLISSAKSAGYDISMRDIAFIVLEREFGDSLVAYRCLFGSMAEPEKAEKYIKSVKVDFMRMTSVVGTKGKATKEDKTDRGLPDITFEENKAELIKLLDRIRKMQENEEIEPKDAIKLETDIRTKLNDKFGTTEKNEEQRVVVESKYNDICPYCRHEVRVKTDEDMLKEIKEKYELIPKKK